MELPSAPFKSNLKKWKRSTLKNFNILSKNAFLIFSENGTFKPKLKKYIKKNPCKKSFYIFWYFEKWNFLAVILRNFLYFLKRMLSLYLENVNPKKLLIFEEVTFWAQKIKSPLWEKFSYFAKWNFLAPKSLIKPF